MPIIETEPLILRDFIPSDWDALNVFLSDPAFFTRMHEVADTAVSPGQHATTRLVSGRLGVARVSAYD
ncbi:MAG: hypothetical protein NVSMB42_23230 [Herpetosiphon sp.]